MLRGTRVGVHTVDVRPGKLCQICGVRFIPANEHVIDAAPCKDCRQAGRESGDKTVWGDRSVDPTTKKRRTRR